MNDLENGKVKDLYPVDRDGIDKLSKFFMVNRKGTLS